MDKHANLGFLLKDVTRLYTRRFEERATGFALTLPQCKVLATLSKNEGVSQKRLAELTETDPMSLVRILDRMEADAMVQRCSDPDDRRARSLRITDKAKPLLEQIYRIAGETRAEALSNLSDAERTALLELLERVHGNLLQLSALTGAEAAAAEPGSTRARSAG